MNWTEVIQSSIFATILTLVVSIATCVISKVQGYKKMKLQHFKTIYNCLEHFTETRAAVLDECNKMAGELAENLPDVEDKQFVKRYDELYCGINIMISKYSKCLELYLAMSHFLYQYKSLRPIIRAECWELLRIYGVVVEYGKDSNYKIEYAQIVGLVQMIKNTGTWRDRVALYRYLKKFANGR